MSFMCQKDSYLKEFVTKVKSCTPTKKKNLDGFNVILEDTILFPEGGGQPSDWGTINGVSCLEVQRVGAEAIHFIDQSIPAGTEVKIQIDWERRFDHMQQHTAQHLITATADGMFGFQTTSWDIGVLPNVVTIELNTPSITANQLEDIEKAANESLQSNLPVTPSFYSDKYDPELLKFRGLGLPDDHVGVVRVLTIDGVDNALCCGTHVSNLAHIQAIKIVGAEKGKKGKTNLMFLAGKRLLQYTKACYEREKKLTSILKGAKEKHSELAEKAVKHSKALQKTCTTLGRELATLEAKMFKLCEEKESIFIKHRKDGDQDYISVLLAELGDETLTKLITTGDDKEGGMFVLAAPDQLLNDIGAMVCEAFEGKGALSKGAFRGKATKPEKGRLKAEALLREYLERSGVGDSQNQEEVDAQETCEAVDPTDSDIDTKEENEKVEKSPKVKTKHRKKAVKVVGKRVVVYNIPYDIGWQELKDKFREEVGEVVRVELLETPEGKSQGVAAVEFSDPKHARKAMELFQNRKIKDRCIKLREEREQDRFKLLHSQKIKAAKGVGVLGPAPAIGSFSGVPGFDSSGISPLLHQLSSEVRSNVTVTNLDYRVSGQKLKDVFRLAGHVVHVDMNGDKNNATAFITFEHPLEALQAVSMFDNQILYDRKMRVKVGRAADRGNLPSGLKSIGRGLGVGGSPVSGMNGNCLNGVPNLSEQLLQQEYCVSGMLGMPNYGGSSAGMQNIMSNGIGNIGMGYSGHVNNMRHPDYDKVGLRSGVDTSAGNSCRLVVKNLEYNCDWKTLRDHFCDVAEVKYAEVNYDKSGKSTGIGFVRFSSFEEAQRALLLKHKSRLGRRNIEVKFKA